MTEYLIAHLPKGIKDGTGMIGQWEVDAINQKDAIRQFEAKFPQREMTVVSEKDQD